MFVIPGNRVLHGVGVVAGLAPNHGFVNFKGRCDMPGEYDINQFFLALAEAASVRREDIHEGVYDKDKSELGEEAAFGADMCPDLESVDEEGNPSELDFGAVPLVEPYRKMVNRTRLMSREKRD